MATLNLLHAEGMKRQPSDHCIFIYDRLHFETMNYGKNRLLFLLQLCKDQDVAVYEGTLHDVLAEYIELHAITTLVLQKPRQPDLTAVLQALPASPKIQILEDDLDYLSISADSPSFFKYYRKVEPILTSSRQISITHLPSPEPFGSDPE
ncbi:MAG: hypothetical protein EOM08_06245 [Clostridia bacterium]|nr:hypothetical protein [Clostridia bacterium]NCC76019.1 hypothetical protein [Clostridia bacterium]